MWRPFVADASSEGAHLRFARSMARFSDLSGRWNGSRPWCSLCPQVQVVIRADTHRREQNALQCGAIRSHGRKLQQPPDELLGKKKTSNTTTDTSAAVQDHIFSQTWQWNWHLPWPPGASRVATSAIAWGLGRRGTQARVTELARERLGFSRAPVLKF